MPSECDLHSSYNQGMSGKNVFFSIHRYLFVDATYKISLNPLSNLCLNVGFVGNVVARPIGIHISYNLIVISITVFFC